MRILLDTHAFLWWLAGNPRLVETARRAVADDDNDVLISAASACLNELTGFTPMPNSPTDTRRKLRDLLEERSFRTGEITLSTGAKSNFYFDCKPVTLSADGAWLVGMAFLDALQELPERPGAVGGLTHGADPIVSSMVALSYVRECPIEGFYVRKEEKRHGTKRRIENPPEPGTKVVIVDDVVTSGGSLLKAVEQARAAGCEVVAALALVDREEQDGAANVRREVDTYVPLFTRRDFPGAAGVADSLRTPVAAAD